MRKILFAITFIALSLFAENFTLKSSSLKGQLTKAQEFNGFGCSGENISPDLAWENAPKETKSFAVTVYDPDAPTGSGWWHWVVFDIPKDKLSLEKGFGSKEDKEIIQSVTNYGKTGFGGACPPKGDKAHRYIFTVYALDTDKLGLDKNTNPAIVGYYLNTHALAKASLISYYKK
ncbi:YbhB/YbcL family Raf kinase inhibitor-like protein [Arcobacter sp. F155]|uniref:YbhB/YbcL family Raf kinase inhibitor-like protein n=1 Tax=Arcobacter sp. F155 TaxID=2044512 RepID=UPI00100B37EB|nr:YbhB/YbcL family Raf kinase inhibitor-like protein [Arcobacter sp. F155]RXJ76011.1 YbhB/YbcL family Raf kinase inhibitor-like protein [Arcobacter sp. F155]